MDSSPPASRIAVVGADGLVGVLLARALGATAVVYRSPRPGELSIRDFGGEAQTFDAVVNAAGFSGRPGLTDADYWRSHVEATRKLVGLLKPATTFIHVSSASVLGGRRSKELGAGDPPDPDTFPFPSYARAKLESEQVAQSAARELGIHVILLRPAVVYAPGAHGMLRTMVKLARRGLLLQIAPRAARQHLCSAALLADVARAVLATKPSAGVQPPYLVADPFVLSSGELADEIDRIAAARGRRTVRAPLPARVLGRILRHGPHSRTPRLDLWTYGRIFGVLAMDVEYAAGATFDALGLDRARYSRERSLIPFLEGEFDAVEAS